MRACVLLVALLATACGGQSPTDPTPDRAQQNATTFVPYDCTAVGAVLEPSHLVIRQGGSHQVTVRLCYPPASLPFTIAVTPAAVAEGSATIPAGVAAATVTITGKSPGIALVSYTVPNFGRAPATRQIGEIQVIPPAGRRRSAGH
jgi:hypothetical protein